MHLHGKGSFDEAFNGADAVVHTAAAVVLGKDQSIITASVEGTRNVLDRCQTLTLNCAGVFNSSIQNSTRAKTNLKCTMPIMLLRAIY